MKMSLILLLGISIIGSLILAACGSQAVTTNNFMEEGEFERPDPPADFANAVNPIEGDSEAVKEGQTLYQANCVSCHGTTGKGDGPAANTLNPKPADLGAVQSTLSDGYLFWRISDGGMMEPFRSVMPAWRGVLNEEQTWKLITFIRTFGG